MGIFLKEKKKYGQVVIVPVNEIDVNPNQPRKYFDRIELENLAITHFL